MLTPVGKWENSITQIMPIYGQLGVNTLAADALIWEGRRQSFCHYLLHNDNKRTQAVTCVTFILQQFSNICLSWPEMKHEYSNITPQRSHCIERAVSHYNILTEALTR